MACRHQQPNIRWYVFTVKEPVPYVYARPKPGPKVANTLRSTSIKYRSDAKVSDRYLIDVGPRGFAIWIIAMLAGVLASGGFRSSAVTEFIWLLKILNIFSKFYNRVLISQIFAFRISLSCRIGSLTCVVGAVGAGKSSLLSAVLGEMHKSSGFIAKQVNTVCVLHYWQFVRGIHRKPVASLDEGLVMWSLDVLQIHFEQIKVHTDAIPNLWTNYQLKLQFYLLLKWITVQENAINPQSKLHSF